MLFIIILALVIGMIIGGVLLLKRTANKFDLTDEQLTEIKKRNQQFDEEE